VSVVKHAHHHFDVAGPGRHSWLRPTIEVHCAANVKPVLFPNNPEIIAIAADVPIDSRLQSARLDAVAPRPPQVAMPVEGLSSSGED
jgi:hypothetical protein